MMAAIIGYLSMAIGTIGLLSSIGDYAAQTRAIVVLGYAVYLVQAGVLHGYLYFTDKNRPPARLYRSCLATLLFAEMMSFFALRTLADR